jgi:hypothetical protein
MAGDAPLLNPLLCPFITLRITPFFGLLLFPLFSYGFVGGGV